MPRHLLKINFKIKLLEIKTLNLIQSTLNQGGFVEQLNLFLHPEVSALEEVANLKTTLDKLRRSFFKRYEIEMDTMKQIEERLGNLENAASK